MHKLLAGSVCPGKSKKARCTVPRCEIPGESVLKAPSVLDPLAAEQAAVRSVPAPVLALYRARFRAAPILPTSLRLLLVRLRCDRRLRRQSAAACTFSGFSACHLLWHVPSRRRPAWRPLPDPWLRPCPSTFSRAPPSWQEFPFHPPVGRPTPSSPRGR